MNKYYFRVEGVRALQLITAPDQATAEAKAKFLGNAVLAYGCTDDIPDIKRPVPPVRSTPIHDPWGLSRLG